MHFCPIIQSTSRVKIHISLRSLVPLWHSHGHKHNVIPKAVLCLKVLNKLYSVVSLILKKIRNVKVDSLSRSPVISRFTLSLIITHCDMFGQLLVTLFGSRSLKFTPFEISHKE